MERVAKLATRISAFTAPAGRMISVSRRRGCVNMRNEGSEWPYGWVISDAVYPGTLVAVHEQCSAGSKKEYAELTCFGGARTLWQSQYAKRADRAMRGLNRE